MTCASSKKKSFEQQEAAKATGKVLEGSEGEAAVFTQIDRKAYESSIVAVYSRRKRKLQDEAKEAGKPLSQLRYEPNVINSQGRLKWTLEEELDLNRYRKRELDRKSRGRELEPPEKQELYQLRCKMIDKLKDRIQGPESELQPEPEPEPSLGVSRLGVPSPSPIKAAGGWIGQRYRK